MSTSQWEKIYEENVHLWEKFVRWPTRKKYFFTIALKKILSSETNELLVATTLRKRLYLLQRKKMRSHTLTPIGIDFVRHNKDNFVCHNQKKMSRVNILGLFAKTKTI